MSLLLKTVSPILRKYVYNTPIVFGFRCVKLQRHKIIYAFFSNMAESEGEFDVLVAALKNATDEFAVAVLKRTTVKMDVRCYVSLR